ncbi:MAG: RES family NAD+ phosphorylase [Pseudobdellovibrionaceae bacterium]|nr:RES family NAD+ phosphorylase [Bdellovibrionales bacterium]USN47241.1 MAG: RES family NAD+ phosphorylase [Pseudobdellovibrionaceae bacterium]
MLQSIWTQCGVKKSDFISSNFKAIRIVEAQAQQARFKLVDSIEEVEILEELLENQKPPVPKDDKSDDKLVFTPFRYPPLRHGSRFGKKTERGIWYGAKNLVTDFYEAIYYRFLFREHSPALKYDEQNFSMTSFKVSIKTKKCVDLTKRPFAQHRDRISAPDSYVDSQQLGSEMRSMGVEAFKYFSARTKGEELSYGIYTPRVIKMESGIQKDHWLVVIKPEAAIVTPYDKSKEKRFEIHRDHYLVDGKFPVIST